jgi:translation initiation factor 2D
VLPARPAGAHVDVKRSSHKKVARFFAAKAAEGLLSLKEDKRSGEATVTAVNRRHPALTSHTLHATAEAAGGAGDADAAGGEAGGAAGAAAHDAPPAPLHIEELVLPSAATKVIFEGGGGARDGVYTAAEATAVLWSYCGAHCGGAASHPSRVLLDPSLCDALFKGVIKKGDGQAYPTEVSRAELPAAFLARCTHVRRVWRGEAGSGGGAASAAAAPPPLLRGALPPLALTLASRAGGKKVTVVKGVEAYAIDVDALASQLRARFAASCAINDLPRPEAAAASRAPPLRELVLQGERAAALATLLEQEWGVPRRCISVPAAALKKKK